MKCLFSADQIQERVHELGERITEDYEGDELVLLGILKGSFVFLADLSRAIDWKKVRCHVDFLALSSYGGGTESTGEIRIVKDAQLSLKEKHVLIVEDIVDTGGTIEALEAVLGIKGVKSVKLCSLLSKPSRNRNGTTIDYLGFEVPDKFVVGYGLDWDEDHRTIPYIAIVEEVE